jgi:hypothetical protein
MWPPARGFGMPDEYDLAEGEMRPSTPVQRLTQRAANGNGKHNSQNTEITEADPCSPCSGFLLMLFAVRCWLFAVR